MLVSIVVPVFNERDSIRPLYQSLTDALQPTGRDFEIIFVDDGSTDGSDIEMRKLAALSPCVKIVELRNNFGQSAAMSAGIQHSVGDVIITIDSDLQNEPMDIPILLAKLDEGFDLVHGWRRQRHDSLITRKIPSFVANRLISWVTRFPVHDLGCTLKAMRREIAMEIDLYGEMHRFIPILAKWRGARCVEIETRHHPRRFGHSKYGISRTLRVLLDLVTVQFLVRHLFSPMRLFGSIALASSGIAILSGVAVIWMKCLGGTDMTGNPLLLLSAIAMMAAIQLFGMGMLGELGTRIYYESQSQFPYAVRSTTNVTRARRVDPSSTTPGCNVPWAA